jgi:hypothetical protein
MASRIIQFLALIFIFSLSKSAYSQIIWNETFEIPEKGFWADSIGKIYSDLSGINWSINIENCNLLSENDYAKTVSTSGGRFEVLDTQGEVVWTSHEINIRPFYAVNISLEASETGSGSVANKKYIKAYYILDKSEPVAFEPVNSAEGDWGFQLMKHKSIKGETLTIVVKMNSSYANDKVFIDNVIVEAVDQQKLEPSIIKITDAPVFKFSDDTVQVSAAVFNLNDEIIPDPGFTLSFAGSFIQSSYVYNENGFHTWQLLPDDKGKVEFNISDSKGKLTEADSSVYIFTQSEIIVADDFEETIPMHWDEGLHWEISNENPITGDQSIKHIEQPEGGMSEFIYTGETFKLNEKDFLFSFTLSNSDWDPSGSNAFYFMLYSNNNEGLKQGYAIGVNATGTSDLVSLWSVENGSPETILAETNFDWDPSQTVDISILRTAVGHWIINAANGVTDQSETATAYNSEIVTIEEMSLIFKYTLTRSGNLWFDNFLIAGSNIPPFIESIKPREKNSFVVEFNEAIITNNLNTSNFELSDRDGKLFEIQSVEILDSQRIKIEAEHNNDTLLILTALSIMDIEGAETKKTTFTFENVLEAGMHDIIFSEIMADVNPEPAGLPPEKYIEIYNRSIKNIQLKNWILYVRDRGWTITSKIIAPGQYVVLCGSEFADGFGNKDKLLVFQRFPDMLVGGTYLSISKRNMETVDEIHYSDQWYGDPEKRSGGFSLERIDINRLCNHRSNWTASNAPEGGTPGKTNSVKAENPDTEAPMLIAATASSLTEIDVLFSEPIDTTSANDKLNYNIEGINIRTVEYSYNSLNVKLKLANSLLPNTDYRFTVRNIFDECGNTLDIASTSFAYHEINENNILINEVLFNPYTGGTEFVELYNNTGFTIDLAKLKFASRGSEFQLRAVYDVSKQPHPFPPGSYMAFTQDFNGLEMFYDIPYPGNIFEVEKLPAYYNTSGNVVVLNDSLDVIDEFAYNEEMHSKWISDPKGVSLERLSINKASNLATNWHSASTLAAYATPGYANSQTETSENNKPLIELESDVISPNGDGYNDELIITFKLNKPGYVINLHVFNAHGKEVKQLSNNELIGHMNQLIFDGRDKSGNLLPMGTYILMADLMHVEEKREIIRKLFHITDKK